MHGLQTQGAVLLDLLAVLDDVERVSQKGCLCPQGAKRLGHVIVESDHLLEVLAHLLLHVDILSAAHQAVAVPKLAKLLRETGSEVHEVNKKTRQSELRSIHDAELEEQRLEQGHEVLGDSSINL